MSDVRETLQDLMARRLREMGRRRGRSALTLREAHEALRDATGATPVSYETCRKILKGEHSGHISDPTADALSIMLDVSVGEILTAAGQRPRLGKFSLPSRADRLDDRERRVVLSVVDAILDAAEGGAEVVRLPESLDTVIARLSESDAETVRALAATATGETRERLLRAIEGGAS